MTSANKINDVQIKALASPVRIEILRLLGAPGTNFAEQWSADPVKDGVCMGLIADALGLSQPTVSRHLDLLKQAGFISVARHQKWAHCKREDDALHAYLAVFKEELLL